MPPPSKIPQRLHRHRRQSVYPVAKNPFPPSEELTPGFVFHTFADDTTIHGLREISKYWPNHSLRIFFILCQCLCWSVMSYHMYLVIHDYLDQPTTVQTATANEKSYPYPSVTFCPQTWLNASKVRAMGMPVPALLYALSFMSRVKIFPKVADLDRAEVQLDQFMNRHNLSTYFELYLTMANDYPSESLFCLECADWPPRKVVTEEGVCYFMTFDDYDSNMLLGGQPIIAYNPITYDNETEREEASILAMFNSVDFSEYVSIGSHVNDYFALDPIYLLLNHVDILQTTPTRHRRLNLHKSRCVESRQDESKLMCEAYCLEEYAHRLCGLPYVLGYFNGSARAGPRGGVRQELWSSLRLPLNTYYNMIDSCAESHPNESDRCDLACPPLCESMTYSTTVQTLNTRKILDDLNESALTLLLSYQVRAGIIETREVNSYTWYSFLSNVGGLIGLWCGASVMSLIQLVIFFGREVGLVICNRVHKGMHQVHAVEEEEETKKERVDKINVAIRNLTAVAVVGDNDKTKFNQY